MVNENNLQIGFSYDPNEKTFKTTAVSNTISLAENSPHLKIFEQKMTVDLGYSIDNTKENLPVIKIDEVALTVRMVESGNEIIEIKDDEVFIITSIPELSTLLFVSSVHVGKNMQYEIKSVSTSLPAYALDEIAKKINSGVGGGSESADETYATYNMVQTQGATLVPDSSYIKMSDKAMILNLWFSQNAGTQFITFAFEGNEKFKQKLIEIFAEGCLQALPLFDVENNGLFVAMVTSALQLNADGNQFSVMMIFPEASEASKTYVTTWHLRI